MPIRAIFEAHSMPISFIFIYLFKRVFAVTRSDRITWICISSFISISCMF